MKKLVKRVINQNSIEAYACQKMCFAGWCDHVDSTEYDNMTYIRYEYSSMYIYVK